VIRDQGVARLTLCSRGCVDVSMFDRKYSMNGIIRRLGIARWLKVLPHRHKLAEGVAVDWAPAAHRTWQ
jgi:hypothetical protein